MIEIKYRQAGPYVSHGRENQGGGDLAAVSRDDLRWYYFLSDVSFKIDEVDLTPPWSWTPVFDLLWSLQGVLGHLERGSHAEVDFTENAELIRFAPVGERVRVSCTYLPAEAVCELVELKVAWLSFGHAVLDQLYGEHPRLAGNPVLAEFQR